MNSKKTISPFGGEQEGASPKGFWQWAIWFNNHFNLMCIVVLYIFALIPVFYVPEQGKTSACLVCGIYFGIWCAVCTKEHKKDNLEKRIENILLIPLFIISVIFLIVWVIIHKFPPDFLPNWAMGLVVITGGFLGIAIGSQIKSNNEDSKRQKIAEEKKYSERILKNQLAEKIKNTGFTIIDEGKYICFHYDEELVNIVKQLKGKK